MAAGRRGRYVRSGVRGEAFEVSVESQNLSRQEARRMEEDGALAVAPKFKAKLIKPMDRSAQADLSGGLWGLEALGIKARVSRSRSSIPGSTKTMRRLSIYTSAL